MATDELTVRNRMVVRLEYSIYLVDGELVETSGEEGPVEFLMGYGQIIPGLETALMGMAVGDEKEVVIPPERGYGEYDEDAFEIVPLSLFPDEVDLELGMAVELVDEETGEALDGIVTEILTDDAVLDLNHPLAGATLRFHVTITGLRQATPSELAKGRVSDTG